MIYFLLAVGIFLLCLSVFMGHCHYYDERQRKKILNMTTPELIKLADKLGVYHGDLFTKGL